MEEDSLLHPSLATPLPQQSGRPWEARKPSSTLQDAPGSESHATGEALMVARGGGTGLGTVIWANSLQGPLFPQLYHQGFELKVVPHVPSPFST